MLSFAEIYIGDDVNQLCLITKNGLPVDLSTASTITVTMTNDPNLTDVATQTWSLANSKLTLNGAIQGGISLTPAAADTANLLAQVQQDLDFVVTISSKIQTYRVPNGLSVLARNT